MKYVEEEQVEKTFESLEKTAPRSQHQAYETAKSKFMHEKSTEAPVKSQSISITLPGFTGLFFAVLTQFQ